MTTGAEKRLTALSVTDGMVCDDPEVMVTLRLLTLVAERLMTRAGPSTCALASAPPRPSASPARRTGRPRCRAGIFRGRCSGLLRDCAEVERAGVVAGHGKRVGHVEAKVEHVRPVALEGRTRHRLVPEGVGRARHAGPAH